MESIISLKTDLTANFNVQLQTLKDQFSSKIDELRRQFIDNEKVNQARNFEETISELNERQTRAKNILIFGIDEQVGNTEERRDKDLNISEAVLNKISPDEPTHIVKTFRIGKNINNSRPRPIKVVLSDQYEAKRILRLKGNLLSTEFSAVTIKDDKTHKQMEFLKSVQDELKSRLNNGESNLTIKYIKSIPTIVKTDPKK